MFGTTLNREYEIAADLLGLDEAGRGRPGADRRARVVRARGRAARGSSARSTPTSPLAAPARKVIRPRNLIRSGASTFVTRSGCRIGGLAGVSARHLAVATVNAARAARCGSRSSTTTSWWSSASPRCCALPRPGPRRGARHQPAGAPRRRRDPLRHLRPGAGPRRRPRRPGRRRRRQGRRSSAGTSHHELVAGLARGGAAGYLSKGLEAEELVAGDRADPRGPAGPPHRRGTVNPKPDMWCPPFPWHCRRHRRCPRNRSCPLFQSCPPRPSFRRCRSCPLFLCYLPFRRRRRSRWHNRPATTRCRRSDQERGERWKRDSLDTPFASSHIATDSARRPSANYPAAGSTSRRTCMPYICGQGVKSITKSRSLPDCAIDAQPFIARCSSAA